VAVSAASSCSDHSSSALVTPDLIRGEAEVTQRLPERLTGVDRVDKLLPCSTGSRL